MKPFRLIDAPRLALIAALGSMLLSAGCASDDEVGRMLGGDAEAIRADKAQIDLDAPGGNVAILKKDQHQLYLDTEKQEHDRGTEDDEFQEGEW